MRDIRPDLRERLEAIATQRMQLVEQENSIRALLQQEELRFASRGSEPLTLTSTVPLPVDVNKLVVSVLSDGPMTAEEIKTKTTALYNFDGKAPGRVLNFTLQGMAKSGIVEKIEDRWKLTEAVQ